MRMSPTRSARGKVGEGILAAAVGSPSETEHDPGSSSSLDIKRLSLEVVEGADMGTTLTTNGEQASIGAHPANNLVLDDPRVSRFHCDLQIGASGIRVVDTASRNGTYLDGVRIESAFLRHGSVIRVGRTHLRCDFVDGTSFVPLFERKRFGRLVGQSVAMRATFSKLQRAASTDSTVLLLGETGTGKELAARSLHEASARADKPFVVVDCASLLFSESELFGHVRGAFTGAVSNRVGAFEAAHGGTIFLDELGEIPMALQPKLLRVLEDRTVQRVGSTERRPVDVRIIAATHRDLRVGVNEGKFRPDLYYRVAVMSVRLPSLRERPEDIPLLARALSERQGLSEESLADLLSEEHLGRLREAAWPGNVRQLRNYLERAAVLGTSESHIAQSDAPGQLVDTSVPFFDARAGFEKRYLMQLLHEHNHSPTAVATASGLSRAYLYELLEKYGLR